MPGVEGCDRGITTTPPARRAANLSATPSRRRAAHDA